MKRRDFLTTAFGGATLSVAGCSNGPSQERVESLESELNSTKDELEHASERIDALQTTITEQSERIEELKTQTDNKEKRAQALTEKYEGEKRKQILIQYSWALGIGRDATELYQQGSDYGEDRNYDSAEIMFSGARYNYHVATGLMREAKEAAQELDEQRVATYSRNAELSYSLWRDTCEKYTGAYNEYEHGEFDSGDEYIEDGNSYYEQATRYTVEDLAVIESELGVTLDTEDVELA